MPLAREQRNCLAHLMRWARANGWRHDVYPNTWRSADGQRHVRFDGLDSNTLVIDRQTTDPLRCHVSLVPVETPETAVNVLAALGYIPAELSPMGQGLIETALDNMINHLGEPPTEVPVEKDEADSFDSPACFADAGQAFADWVDGRITSERAAEVLSNLAHQGLIVSVAYHDETCGEAGAAVVDGLEELDQRVALARGKR